MFQWQASFSEKENQKFKIQHQDVCISKEIGGLFSIQFSAKLLWHSDRETSNRTRFIFWLRPILPPTGVGGAPERIRTSDLRYRKPPLYPAELRAHNEIIYNIFCWQTRKILYIGYSQTGTIILFFEPDI